MKTRADQIKTTASAAGRGDSCDQKQRNKACRCKENRQQLNAENAATPVRVPQRSHISLLSVVRTGHPTCRNAATPSYEPQRSYASPKGARPGGRGHSIAQLDRGTSNREVKHVKHNRLNGNIQMGGRSDAADVVYCAGVSGGGDETENADGSRGYTVARHTRMPPTPTGSHSRNRRPEQSPEGIESCSERDSWWVRNLRTDNTMVLRKCDSQMLIRSTLQRLSALTLLTETGDAFGQAQWSSGSSAPEGSNGTGGTPRDLILPRSPHLQHAWAPRHGRGGGERGVTNPQPPPRDSTSGHPVASWDRADLFFFSHACFIAVWSAPP